jgi:N utilization substance protein B
MALPPQKFREALLQLLYIQEFCENTEGGHLPLLMEMLKISKARAREVEDKAKVILRHRVDLVAHIESISDQYAMVRIPKMELSILKLCLYELLLERTLPKAVVIAEGIRLAKKFSTPESSSFIHALLAKAAEQEGVPNIIK